MTKWGNQRVYTDGHPATVYTLYWGRRRSTAPWVILWVAAGAALVGFVAGRLLSRVCGW